MDIGRILDEEMIVKLVNDYDWIIIVYDSINFTSISTDLYVACSPSVGGESAFTRITQHLISTQLDCIGLSGVNISPTWPKTSEKPPAQ